MTTTDQQALDDLLSQLLAAVRSKTIPVIFGRFLPDGAPVVDMAPDHLVSNLVHATNDALCIADVDRKPATPPESGAALHFSLFVFLGRANLWLSCRATSRSGSRELLHERLRRIQDHDPTGEPGLHASHAEDDGEGEDDWVPPDPSVLLALAYKLAIDPAFGALRNKEQRRRLAESIRKAYETPAYYGPYEIAEQAENLYEYGVLPRATQTLAQEGKSMAEIARAIGVSRTRAERALHTPIPAHIQQDIAEAERYAKLLVVASQVADENGT